jgi:hypothetical protein
MIRQQYSWTCSVASFDWVCKAIGIPMDREQALSVIGYPGCVNETYGLMSSQCMVNAFESVGIDAIQKWVTFEEAYSICQHYTGVINPLGMYHYMGIRGVENGSLWLANSAQGYRGLYENMDVGAFNALGPVQVIYCASRI